MATTLEELEKRVTALEQAVADWRGQNPAPPENETKEERIKRFLRSRSCDQAGLSAAWEKWFADMGITAKPIGAEKLQEMLLAEGLDPNDNSFSRGIIEMREE
jgi:hypothetical protein